MFGGVVLIYVKCVKVSKAFNIRPSRSRVGLELATYGLRKKRLDLLPRELRYFSLIRYWYCRNITPPNPSTMHS